MPELIKGLNIHEDDDMDASALLPLQNASGWDGVAQSRMRDGAHIPFQSGDGTAHSERNIWRLFESYKRSAVLHTNQFLQYNCALSTDRISFVEPGPLERVAGNSGQVSATFWDRKAAQDNLLGDLQVLQSLLDHMLEVSKKGLSNFFALITFLTITTSLSSSNAGNGSKRLWAPSLIALTASSGYTGYRTLKYSVVYLCSEVINSLLHRLEHNILDEQDRDILEGRRFQLLWWIYHLTAQESEIPT